MAPVETPKIDKRRVNDLLQALITSIPRHLKDWKTATDLPSPPQTGGASDSKERSAYQEKVLAVAEDPQDFGMALLKLTARMGEIIIDQLNRVPEKYFLAFLDLAGIDLLPPKTARVPLTFSLVDKAPDDGFVPRGTRVGAAKADDVVFETEEDLVVARASVQRVYSLDPEKDRSVGLDKLLIGVGSEGMAVFDGAGSTGPIIDHVLYLGDSTLFTLAAEANVPVTVTLGLAGGDYGRLDWQYSGKDGWVSVRPVKQSKTEVQFYMPGVTETVVEGYDQQGRLVKKSSCWIRAKTTQPLPAQVPLLSSITGKVEVAKKGLKPDMAFLNNLPKVDLGKDFYLFGERPKFNDAFYIGSQEVFSRHAKHATHKSDVIMTVTKSESVPVPTTSQVTLAWEYWNGTDWNLVGQSKNDSVPTSATAASFSDGSQAFTVFDTAGKASITFGAPKDWKQSEWNGEKSYWLRVRIVSGNYGKEATYTPTTQDEIKALLTKFGVSQDKVGNSATELMEKGIVGYTAETFHPPSLKSLTLSYTCSRTESPEIVLAVNHSIYEDVTTKIVKSTSFQLFDRPEETAPTLYVGFDPNPAKPVRGTPISLFVQLAQRGSDQDPGADAASTDSPPNVMWRYWNGNAWAPLAVEDETRNFTQQGRVRFIGPAAIKDRLLFGERLLWIKASLEAGGFSRPPKLQGIFSNTVWAQHGVTHREQLLGSSNGEPNQVMAFPKTPVLDGQRIEVREPILPSEVERQRIILEEGPDAIRTVKDEAGNITEVWVQWHPVVTFTLSGPMDRHYVIDRIKGRLLFGNGMQGLIPPGGKDNIKAVVYRSGGGEVGNRPAGTITEMKTTFPFVASVVNHHPAIGGSDQEERERVTARGSRHIKTRDRAVTAEDYDWLAYQASGEVAKVRCLPMTQVSAGRVEPNNPGWATVIVVPRGEEDQPVLTQGLRQAVKDYLSARSLVTLANRIDVIGPDYTAVTVTATVIPKRIEESRLVEKRVIDNLKSFLHPIRGGQAGNGWEFGRAVYLSEIAAVIARSEGVDQVEEITLTAGQVVSRELIEIPPNGLPSSGQHTITSAWR